MVVARVRVLERRRTFDTVPSEHTLSGCTVVAMGGGVVGSVGGIVVGTGAMVVAMVDGKSVFTQSQPVQSQA